MFSPNRIPPTRDRRGLMDLASAPWRRCTPGPNRISSIGVWKKGSRRACLRPNRSGETGWRRPFRAAAGGTH